MTTIMKNNLAAWGLVLAGLIAYSAGTYAYNTPTLGPAEDKSFKDPANVDLLTGLPNFTKTDLAIGNGKLKLEHTFSSSAGWFAGFYDISLSRIEIRPYSSCCNQAYVRLGQSIEVFEQNTSGTYSSTSYKGGKLTVTQNEKIYTNRDGVSLISKTGELTKIVQPNGFTMYLDGANDRVSTNNGLSFYYKRRSTSPYRVKKITAVNNAFDYCSGSQGSCSFDYSWPASTYKWPEDGNISNGEYTFEATNAEGVTTKYVQKKYTDPHQNKLYTRIVRVYDNGSLLPTQEYDYYLFESCADGGAGNFYWSCSGYNYYVDTATVGGITFSYFMNLNTGVYGYANGRSESELGNSGISNTTYKGGRPTTSSSYWPSGNASYDTNSPSNRITSTKDKGIDYDFEYDGRGNITKRTQNPISTDANLTLPAVVLEAGYPSSCSNIKTCNKPNWVKDGNGGITYYSYHGQSGEIRKIILPPNDQGLSPATHFEYTKKFAKFYDPVSGSLKTDTVGIWLLTKKVDCLSKSASTATESDCRASDKVTTTCSYGSSSGVNNLWLTEQVVTSTDGSVRRTCYEYDRLGNQIGIIEPNANLDSCS